MATNALISLIVTTYNRPEALLPVIEACFDQTDMHFELIIADDGSGDDTRRCIDQLRGRAPVTLLHIWQPDAGFRLSMARNRGILVARGDYIVILDGDCIPQHDFIAQHRRLAQRGRIVTGSRILMNRGFSEQVLATRLDLHRLGGWASLRLRLRGALNKCLPLLLRLPDVGRQYRAFSYRRIKGCNLAIWREDLVKVNGFDESFIGWGHEDADLVLRLHNAGVTRKDGAYATEVLHLWHEKSWRDNEAANRARVRQRERDGTVRAQQGLREHADGAPDLASPPGNLRTAPDRRLLLFPT